MSARRGVWSRPVVAAVVVAGLLIAVAVGVRVSAWVSEDDHVGGDGGRPTDASASETRAIDGAVGCGVLPPTRRAGAGG